MIAVPDCPTTLAVVAIDVARDHLARYALQTDSPAFGVVDAADLLDGARNALTEGMADLPCRDGGMTSVASFRLPSARGAA